MFTKRFSKPSKSSNMSNRPVMENLESRTMMSTTPTIMDGQALHHEAAMVVSATLPVAPRSATTTQAVHADAVATMGVLDNELGTGSIWAMSMKNPSGNWPATGSVQIRIDNEILEGTPTAMSNGTIRFDYVTRALNGTVAQAHHVGAVISLANAPAPVADDTSTTQFVNIGGALWEHVGTDRNKNWFKLWDAGITQVSGSLRAADTCFVLFNDGSVWEHVGRDKNSGWSRIWSTNVKQISAGVQAVAGRAQADVVFCLFNSGALYEHVGQDSNSGWFSLYGTGVTQISASQGQADTVFANFSGAVWEHNGRSYNAGWTKVWDTAIVQISAASAQADTVFVIFNGGALYEHTGLNKSLGWSKLWDTGVTQVAAAPYQRDTAFVLFGATGALYEHSGLDKSLGWSKLWSTGITQIAAAGKTDTVLVNFGGALWQHTGLDSNSGWSKIWDLAVTNMSGGAA